MHPTGRTGIPPKRLQSALEDGPPQRHRANKRSICRNYILGFKIVAQRICVPLRRVEQPLDALRIALAYGFGHLPAVLAFDPT
jgi:hypothetical protein